MIRIIVKNLISTGCGSVLLIAVVAISLSSCKGGGDIVPKIDTSYLNFVNADTASLNIYQNGTRLNILSGISPGSQSGHLIVSTGTIDYQIKKSGLPNYLINDLQLKLSVGQSYTLFAAGETIDKFFLIPDTGTVSTQLASVRYINASPNTVNLTVTLRDSLTFTNRAFKSVSNFAYLSGKTTVVRVYQAGSNTPLLSQNVTLVNTGVYTLFTRGVIGGTGQNKLAINIYQ